MHSLLCGCSIVKLVWWVRSSKNKLKLIKLVRYSCTIFIYISVLKKWTFCNISLHTWLKHFLLQGVTALRDVDLRSCYITNYDPEWSLDQDGKIAVMETVVCMSSSLILISNCNLIVIASKHNCIKFFPVKHFKRKFRYSFWFNASVIIWNVFVK